MVSAPNAGKAITASESWAVNDTTTPLSGISGVPLYVQIRESLRAKITAGLSKSGQRIPSEEDLAGQFGVSRVTVRQAIGDLIDDGLLYRRHGKGTFVALAPINRDHTRLTDFSEDPSVEGMEVQLQILNNEIVPAQPKVAQALALREGDPVVRVESLRTVDGEPVTLYCEYVSERLFPKLLEKELGSCSLWTLLERHGLKVERAVEKLEARLADQASARVLQVEEGTPILHKEKTIFSKGGTPLEYQECDNRGDKYTCTVVLRR